MKEQYQVLFQRGYEEKEGRWLNGGMCYMSKDHFDTLEEAIKCRDTILEKERCIGRNFTYDVNGIGITVEYDDNIREELKLKNIKIRKRLVSKWEEV